MIKLEAGEGYFIVDEHTYPVGKYRILYRGINVGLEEIGGLFIVSPTSYMDWRDEFDGVYGTREDLLNDLRSKIFTRY